MLSAYTALSQIRPAVQPDTTGADSLRISVGPGSLKTQPSEVGAGKPVNWDSVRISPDALEEEVDYSAHDSMYFDIKNNQIHLYGQAEVKFQDMTITADYMMIDWKESIILAEGRQNSLGEWVGKPHFNQGSQDFYAFRLKYNFKTFKGIFSEGQSMQEGMNIVGEKGKFVGAGKDTTKQTVIYNRNAIFSTCELDHPHFGIRSSKQKIVQDKVAVVGPSNLVIGDVPTPIWLPFAFFPLKLGQRTGLIFPQGYEYSDNWGFGLERVGWYLPMGEYWDLSLTGDIYLKGTFRIHADARYKKRYKYNGSASVNVSYLRTEVKGIPQFNPSLSLKWVHNQDAKAHPYHSLGGQINFQTSDYQRQNLTDAQSRLSSTISSNMNFNQRFDKPFDLSASFSHSQNTITREMTISFPVVNFQTQTLYPFKRKIKTGGERWYERVQMRYTSEAKNSFTTTDTTLFSRQTLDDAKFGVRHNINTSTSFNLLKYFTVSPSANYKEVWYFKTVNKEFDPTPVIKLDTIPSPGGDEPPQVKNDTLKFGQINDIEHAGFKPYRSYNAGVSMSTKIFGTLLFKRGKLRGLRHVITPTMGVNYTPDYTNPDWGYFKSVRKDLRNDELLLYDVFENNNISGFDRPPATGRQMTLNYGFGNQFEAKVFSKRDSTFKNVKLFNSISVTGNYNMAADTLQWSLVNISGNTNLFNGISSLRVGIVLDPYDFNRATGARINRFLYDTEKRPLRLASWNASLNSNITVARLRDLIKGVNTDQRAANTPRKSEGEGGNLLEDQDLLSLFENFRIAHSISIQRAYNLKSRRDTVVISTNSVYSSGSIQLTPNWSIGVGNFGYDFISKRITYPDFSFNRDLHCWIMGLSWQPTYHTYNFYIRVKPGRLDFINIPYQKGYQDRFRGF